MCGIAGARPWMITAAGLPLALCVYTYHSARLAPLVAVAYVVAYLVVRRRSVGAAAPTTDARRATTGARGMGAALVGALLVFGLALIPAVIGYLRDPDALVQRVGATSVWPLLRDQRSLWPLWETLWRTLLVFHYEQGPEYYWFGIATDPAVNTVIGFLLVHGMVHSVMRWREPRHQLLLVWFAVGLVPGVLSTGAPRLYRAFLATPPLYVWAAMPVARLLATPAAGWSRPVCAPSPSRWSPPYR